MSETLTRQEVVTRLIDLKWSPEGADFLADKINDPVLARLKRAITGEPIPRAPRKNYDNKKPISNRIRKAVFERDAYRCQQCGDWHDLTVDHIHPESKGGTLDMNNLQTLCNTCNSTKGDRV